jgi:hypothetical protein
MVKIGNYNTLTISRIVDFGVYLDAGNSVEILLPAKYLTAPPVVGDSLDVFVYNDSEDRLIATTEKPYATVGQFAFLEVKAVTKFGAFLDWGLAKDLLVPFREQKNTMKEGGIYMVYIYLDDTTKRIAASAKVEKFIGNTFPHYRRGDKVKILVYQHTEIGYKAVVDNLFYGMLYDNELYRPVEIGVEIDGYVKHVRDDGKIDLTLTGEQASRIDALASTIMDRLAQSSGRLSISDSSTPEEIKQMFSCSKKDFKKAIGTLYKKKLIIIADDNISLA